MKGEQVKYVDYNQQRWQMTIRDPAQPTLMLNPKALDIHDRRNTASNLIPELCNVTAL